MQHYLLFTILSSLTLFSLIYSPLTLAVDPSFECLDQSGPLETITINHTSGKFEPDTAPSKKFDARNASFNIPQNISHGKIVIRGSDSAPNMCWAGGYVTATNDWHDLDVSWDQSKSGYDKSGTYRNTTSINSFHHKFTLTGLHVFNVHDGIRTTDAHTDWRVQHVWLDYIRDDCIENDHIKSGTIYDSLFDGCYSGISTRPSSSWSSAGQVITMDKVLLRMEPMPYPYKWETKGYPMLSVSGYTEPFAYGNTFKVQDGNEPDFKITNSIFLHEYSSEKMLFPPQHKVTACQNNTIIWLDDPSTAPNHLLSDFPGCFTLITNRQQGLALWQQKVTDWHQRHPGVGVHRKPSNPGIYTWPRYPSYNPSPTNPAPPLNFNLFDYHLLIQNYAANNPSPSIDLDNDNDVDFLDHQLFISNFNN